MLVTEGRAAADGKTGEVQNNANQGAAKIEDNTITETDIADSFKARDVDKLDGNDSTSFAAATHNHDGRYYTEGESDSRFVNASGDTMSGDLTVSGGDLYLGSDNTYIRHTDKHLRMASRASGGNVVIEDDLAVDRTFAVLGNAASPPVLALTARAIPLYPGILASVERSKSVGRLS